MDMQQHQHHLPPMTQIVSMVEKGGKELEHKLGHPIEVVTHETQHLNELISKKFDEKALPLEESIVDKILADPNTEKLIEYVINSPKTKKIFEDIAEEKLKKLKEELAQQVKELDDHYSDDFKYLTHGLIYFALGTAVVLKLITLYS